MEDTFFRTIYRIYIGTTLTQEEINRRHAIIDPYKVYIVKYGKALCNSSVKINTTSEFTIAMFHDYSSYHCKKCKRMIFGIVKENNMDKLLEFTEIIEERFL